MALAILGSLGGVAAFASAVYVIARAGFNQANATRENTVALKANTEAIGKLDARVDDHDIQIAVIKDRLGKT